MKYIGGKALIARHIASAIKLLDLQQSRYTFIEPFVGGCNILPAVYDQFDTYECYDYDSDLIVLYQAIAEGWQPPTTVTRTMYNTAKVAEQSPLKSFIGYTCSYNGKWFGGYAEDKVTLRNYAQEAVNWFTKHRKAISNAHFACMPYQQLQPYNAVVYCDPPYDATTGYKGANFDTNAFWVTMRQWAQHNTLLISCYKAPADFTVIWRRPKRTSLNHTHNTDAIREERSELLVTYR